MNDIKIGSVASHAHLALVASFSFSRFTLFLKALAHSLAVTLSRSYYC